MNFSNPKAWQGLSSPSSITMAALIGFLCLGELTDWRIISSRSAKARATGRFGAIGHTSGAALASPGREPLKVRNASSDPLSEVADRRNGHEAQQNQREID